ncbi:UNVERIFIED_CONTAM: hypothetical protein Sangu_3252500 [Sesamum angustifolium]|uniref:Uncharacterized protein n=1 Tax=Sesamum angustifolium TaxID=2727405 RepID=A0AAW2JEM5_9LAMI
MTLPGSSALSVGPSTAKGGQTHLIHSFDCASIIRYGNRDSSNFALRGELASMHCLSSRWMASEPKSVVNEQSLAIKY